MVELCNTESQTNSNKYTHPPPPPIYFVLGEGEWGGGGGAVGGWGSFVSWLTTEQLIPHVSV